MKLLESRVIAYDMMSPFIIPYFLNIYDLKVKYLWGNHAATGVNLLKHWYKISLQQEILFKKHSYDNCVNDEDIVRCERTLDLFLGS